MTTLAIGLVLGSLLTFGFCRIRRANDRINWILRGQAQAELTHGWHQPVVGRPMPMPRRSPNEKPVPADPPSPARPVLHDDQR